MRLKIQGTKFSRDLNNMAVLCNDKSEVTKYETELKKFRENKLRDEEINKLKDEITEIKQMLQILIRGQNG